MSRRKLGVLLSAALLLLSTACHGIIVGGPGAASPESSDPLTDGLWAQTYTVDWKPVGNGGVAGSPTWQFELSSAPEQECNYIACWSLIAMTWQGYVHAPSEGDYVVNNYADDGAKVWIDGNLVINNWYMGGFFGGNSASATVHLTAGDHTFYEEYYNANGLEADTSTSIPGTTWRNRGALGKGTPAAEGAPDSLADGFGNSPLGQFIADPVNSYTGSLTLSQTDLRLPARGLPLSFSRTYNARDTRSGLFGRGWTSTVEARVQERGNGQVAVTNGDGRRDVFTLQSDGTYKAPQGIFDTLTHTSSGWSVLTHDQLTFDFASSGSLARISDRVGNSVSVQVDQPNGHITQLSDAMGRALSFSYNPDGHLAQVADASGRIVRYDYASDGTLSSVTDPSGAATRYGYDTSGHLTTATDPLGAVTMTNAYDTQGRVISQSDAAGATTHFAYDDASHTTTITNPLGRTTTVLHDAQGEVLQTTDAAGQSVSYTYDDQGNRTRYTDRNSNPWRFSYDSRGNRTGVVDPVGGIAQFAYDAQNNLIARTDPLGHAWHYAYDGRGVLTSVTDPTGATSSVATDSFGQPSRVVDADGVARSLTYDAAGNVLSVTDAAGAIQNAYDAAGRALSVTDQNGHTTRVSYDIVGRPTALTDALGNTTHLDYDAASNLTSIADASGATTQFHYDTQGRVVEAIDALGQHTRVEYDADGNRSTVTDASGQSTQFSYDALDRLVKITDALGGTTTLGYDSNGNLTSAIDARGGRATFEYDFRNARTSATDRTGARTTFSYDAGGRMVSAKDAAGATTTYGYDAVDRLASVVNALSGRRQATFTPAGRLASQTDPNGQTTTFAYDSAGRQISVADAMGGKVTFAYDGAGNLNARTDQLGRTTTYQYDALNRLQQVVDALGGTTRASYDSVGRVVQSTDANGHTTQYGYDALSRLLSVTDALGAVTRYGYDARGLLTSATDANGHTRQYAYDALGRQTASTDALGHSQQFSYDPSGNATSLVDGNGQTSAYSYDAEDRLTGISYADGKHVQYAYDAVGRRTSMVDSLGTTSYQYDPLGRLTRLADPFGKVVQYAYDANGNRIGLTYPDAMHVQYGYDALGRLSQVTDAQQGVDHYAYDAVGNATGLQLANGTRWQATYDAVNRLLSKSTLDSRGRAMSTFAYTYDAKGNLSSAQEAIGNGDEHSGHGDGLTYSYDALDRLVQSGRGNFQTQYQYDAVGNRLDVSALRSEHEDRDDRDHDAIGLQAQYDATNQLTAIVGPNNRPLVNFSYDGNGNLLSRDGFGGPTTYSWDGANRLTSVNSAFGPKTSYSYNGDGDLYQEQTSVGAGQSDRPLGSLTYTLDQGSPLSQVLSATDGRQTASYLYGLERLSGTSGRDTVYYGTDVRGSVRTLTDARGKLRGLQSYDPFGVALHSRDGDDGEGFFGHLDDDGHPAGRGNLLGLFGYTGERQDAATGLVNLRARWYQPTAGRFISRDSLPGQLSDPLSQNAYLYAGANPTTFVDPSGHFKQLLGNAAQGAGFYASPYVEGTGNALRSGWQWASSDEGLETIQTVLDVASFVPGLNVPASLAGSAVAVARGDYGGAALRAAGVIVPAAGGAVLLSRVAVRGREVISAAEHLAPLADELVGAERMLVDPQLDTNFLIRLQKGEPEFVNYAQANMSAGLSYNFSTRAEFLDGLGATRADLRVLEQRYAMRLIREIPPAELQAAASRLQNAFAGTGRVLRAKDARVAASAFLKNEKLATGDEQFFKRSLDLGLSADFVGSGPSAARSAAYVPKPVVIP